MPIRLKNKGFTLIEMIIVMVIIGIMSLVVIPKFIDMVDMAKCQATKGILGSVNSALYLKYAERSASGNPSFPTSLTASDFANNTEPLNKLTGVRGVRRVFFKPSTLATSNTNGFWYIRSTGVAGAYSDGTIDTETCQASGGGGGCAG